MQSRYCRNFDDHLDVVTSEKCRIHMSQNCLSVGDYYDLMALGNYHSVDNPDLVDGKMHI